MNEKKIRNINVTINEVNQTLIVQSHWTLSRVLRNGCGQTGTKEACHEGACGACTVLIDGVATPACMVLAIEQDGKNIETIEGLAKGDVLHPIQEAWLEEYAAQCAFCSAGFIMTSKELLAKNALPTDAEIKEALSGNLCLCSNYEHIINAVRSASQKIAKGSQS